MSLIELSKKTLQICEKYLYHEGCKACQLCSTCCSKWVGDEAQINQKIKKINDLAERSSDG